METNYFKSPVFTKSESLQYVTLTLTWVFVNILFWFWWLQPQHYGNSWLFWFVSLAFFYDGTVLPSMFWYYLGRMKKPQALWIENSNKSIGRVAMITLTVPGAEDREIVREHLEALSKVEYPHDSWILVDKVHSPEIKELALSYGVKYFCRHDIKTWGEKKVAYWNQQNPPYQAKTKAGNVNAWIDAYGSMYEYFTQLDIDHTPRKDYLNLVLGYFVNAKIAWVQAPSVYDNFNFWTSNGAAEQELVLQGPLQMGFYGATATPFIIGSHATYRMSAIVEIGGFQPTRAEDHLDTLYLAAKGYKGIYLPKIIAKGHGPETFETYLAQQFAWSYSLMQVLLYHTQKMIWKLKPQVALQMLFSETWYPLWSLSMIILFIAPTVALVTGDTIGHVSLWEFLIYSTPLSAVAFFGWFWSRKWHKPKGIMLSWRGFVLHIARWVVVLSADIQAIFRVQKPYMITEKGMGNTSHTSASALVPYLFLFLLPLSVNIWYLATGRHGLVQGYLLFTIEEAFLMLLVITMPLAVALKKNTIKSIVKHKLHAFFLLVSFCFFIVVGNISFMPIMSAVWPTQSFVFVATTKKNSNIDNKMKIQKKSIQSTIPSAEYHIVKSGESLWKISQSYYGNGVYWTRLVTSDGDTIIHPGDQIEIPPMTKS